MAKAATRAAKLRQKRGRKAMPATETTREPNGRKSRRKVAHKARTDLLEHQVMEVATARRIRHYDIADRRGRDGNVLTAEQQAKDTRHGYLLGRMLLDGTISKQQHDAGLRYAEDISRYHGLTGVPFPSARAQDLFAIKGSDGDESESKADRARAARDKMQKLRAVLLSAGDINTGRRVQHTVNVVCVEDIDELRTLNGLMAEWLRRGLNKLAALYEIGA
jgi:hypothetical protein